MFTLLAALEALALQCNKMSSKMIKNRYLQPILHNLHGKVKKTFKLTEKYILLPLPMKHNLFLMWSISSTFFAQILRTKVHLKPNSKQRKDICTKNLRVKC